VSLLERVKQRAPELDITLVAYWQPWVAWKYRTEIGRMSAVLRSKGIHQVNIPAAVIPSRHFLYRTTLFPVLHRWLRLLFKTSLGNRFDIVHCRGYLASFIAAEIKSRYGYRVVFDMRSFWPKEHVSIGAWTMEDGIYDMWDRIETFTMRHSDAVVVVSAPMLKQVAEKAPSTLAVDIPICVDTAVFKFDETARAVGRRDLGWGDRRIIVYQGSLGLLNANIREVAEYLVLISQLDLSARFLILTANTTVDVVELLKHEGLQPERFAVRHPATAQELAGWLSAADAGIHAMSPGPDSPTRLSAKVVEYLSCGLPVIVNQWVGAAAELVKSRDVGAVIDVADREGARASVEALFSRVGELSERSRALAVEKFSVDRCAGEYADLYRTMFDKIGGPVGRPERDSQ
jgi:glycosyltransferase involved in cell wall biosynthesis